MSREFQSPDAVRELMRDTLDQGIPPAVVNSRAAKLEGNAYRVLPNGQDFVIVKLVELDFDRPRDIGFALACEQAAEAVLAGDYVAATTPAALIEVRRDESPIAPTDPRLSRFAVPPQRPHPRDFPHRHQMTAVPVDEIPLALRRHFPADGLVLRCRCGTVLLPPGFVGSRRLDETDEQFRARGSSCA